MRSALLKTLPILVAISIDGFAQDSKFPPKGQQIPVSECLTIKGLWEGARSPMMVQDRYFYDPLLYLRSGCDVRHMRQSKR